MGVALVTNSPEYKLIHKELYQTYGLASQYDCEYCDKQAKDWAWIPGTDPLDIENYWPLCRSCHRLEDFTDEWRTNISKAIKGKKRTEVKAWV